MNLLWFPFSCLTIGVSVARFVCLGTHLSQALSISKSVFLMAAGASLFQGTGMWVGAHSCSDCFNIAHNCSSGIWKFLCVFILIFIFPVPTLPKRWPSQTSLSTSVGAQGTIASTPRGSSSSVRLWIPRPAEGFQKTHTIAVLKGYWLSYGRELWIAKTGLRYLLCQCRLQKQTADAGNHWSYEAKGIKRENLS